MIDGSNSRYNNSRVITKKGKYSIGTTIFEVIPETSDDILVKTVFGDRFDLLANKYYGDPHLWWYIAKANNKKLNTIDPDIIIRIPSSANYAKQI